MNYNRENEQRRLSNLDDTLVAERAVLKRRKSSYLQIFGISLALVIALVLLYGASRLIFKVDRIEVLGNERYLADDIIEKSGIEIGGFMFSFASSDIEKKIAMQLPYIESVSMKRQYPSTVVLSVSEIGPRYATVILQKQIIFSSDLKVLEVSDHTDDREDLIFIKIPAVRSAIEGHKIDFYDIENTKYITDFILSVSELGGGVKVNFADLTDSFSLKMKCNDNYEVQLGKADELNIKMRTLAKVLNSDKLNGVEGASIDMSDPKEPSFVPIYVE